MKPIKICGCRCSCHYRGEDHPSGNKCVKTTFNKRCDICARFCDPFNHEKKNN